MRSEAGFSEIGEDHIEEDEQASAWVQRTVRSAAQQSPSKKVKEGEGGVNVSRYWSVAFLGAEAKYLDDSWWKQQ